MCCMWHFCIFNVMFCFSSIRRHTRCALVTGVQTCALPFLSLVGNAREARFPLLIQQSDDEFRGAVASVTALQQAGKAAALFVFPGEHHIKWQPAHRLAVYERNIRWFDYWLRGIGTNEEWMQN